MNYLKSLVLKKRAMEFPIYFPDATRGVIRTLDSRDLREVDIEGVVVNGFHLSSKPGATVLKSLGGIKEFMNWDGLVVSDSGGFQLLSLVYENKSFGKINDNGITFYRDSKGEKNKHIFTPEKSIQTQFNIGADIMICLDDCPSAKATSDENHVSVRRTIEWAKRSKDEFQKRIDNRHIDEKPLLFAVIHGGNDKELREICTNELIKIGFDGFCFGGWPLDSEKRLNLDILSFTASFMPDNVPKFALGVGNPKAIVDCVKVGYNIFDCVLPTRDARHHRLYIFTKDPNDMDIFNEHNLTDFLYIMDEKYVRDPKPISTYCDCYACKNYSRSYLHHLFKIEDALAWRLATIHNLRTYTQLIAILRENV
jgi:queuine tRNA-ribosyltransferase